MVLSFVFWFAVSFPLSVLRSLAHSNTGGNGQIQRMHRPRDQSQEPRRLHGSSERTARLIGARAFCEYT
jgi:hypothetical protein